MFITSLFFIAVSAIPLLGSVGLLFAPAPLLFYRTKLGDVEGIVILALSLAATGVALSLAGSGVQIAYYLYLLGALGLMLGHLAVKRHTIELTVAYASLLCIMLGVMLLAVHSYGQGVSPLDSIHTYVMRTVVESVDAFALTGAASEQVEVLRGNTQVIAGVVMQMMFSFVIVGTCFIAWLNMVTVKLLCRATGAAFPDTRDLTRWVLDDRMIWIAIAAGFSLLLPFRVVQVAGANVMLLVLFLYMMQGIAVTEHFFHVKKVPPYLSIPLYALIFFQVLLLLVVIIIGVADIWIDFRKLRGAG